MTDDDLKNLEHSVERHEEAINQDATDIAQLKRQIGLIIEVLEKLDVYKFQGMEHHERGEKARDRYREIVKELKANHAPEK